MKKIAPIVVAVIVAAVIVAVVIAYLLLIGPSAEVKLITKSPEEMVLKLADVPPENYSGMGSRSITIDYLQSVTSYLPADIWQQAGFENGHGVQFNYQEGYSITCTTLRFSSIEGAKILFNAMENSVTGSPTYGRFVTIPKIGDQHFAMEYSTPAYPGAHQPVGIGFRKANVCVFLSTYGSEAPWVMDDAVGWARTVESRTA